LIPLWVSFFLTLCTFTIAISWKRELVLCLSLGSWFYCERLGKGRE
jgi:hypothetical protein